MHDNRLDLAKELGATHTLNSKNVDIIKEVQTITDGGSHCAVETTGVPEVVKQALAALKPLGTLAIVGVTPEVTFNIQEELMAEGKSIIGVVEGDSIPKVFIPQLVAYYKNGQFPFDKLVKFYDFEEITEAFTDSAEGSTIKPILRMPK